MMAGETLVLFEVDICVPAQQFRIEYSLIEKGGLPFVSEFLLRLLKVSPLMSADIARYFGFTSKELSTALTPFFQKGEVSVQPDGRIGLSEKGLRLFSGNEDSPSVRSRHEYRRSFTFDLLTFSYLGGKVSSASTKRAVLLDAGVEVRAVSQERAVGAFQNNLHEIFRRGDLTGQDQQDSVPELYKISDVRKSSDVCFLVEEALCLDADSLDLSFEVKKGIAEEEEYIGRRASMLHSLNGRDNLDDVVRLADRLGDSETIDALSRGWMDFRGVAQRALSFGLDERHGDVRIYGSLQLNRNWDQVCSLLKKHHEKISGSEREDATRLTWLAPCSHGLWGKSSRHGQALSRFVEFAGLKNKRNDRHAFEAEILIPLSSSKDWQSKKAANNDCAEAKEYLHGFVESEALAPLEVFMLSGCFAVVIYHLVVPDRYPVPIPFGFITEDPARVRSIEGLVRSVLDEYSFENKPRYLGGLADLGRNL